MTLIDAVVKVKQTMILITKVDAPVRAIYFKNGIAVMVDKTATYWIKDDTVYAANGFAKAWSPSINYIGDSEICFKTIHDAIEKGCEV